MVSHVTYFSKLSRNNRVQLPCSVVTNKGKPEQNTVK